jgi:hypothetical protein
MGARRLAARLALASLLCSLGLAGALRAAVGGWTFVLLAPFYLLVAGCFLLTRWPAVRAFGTARHPGRLLAALLLADGLLLVGFLLQYDFGDSGGGWLVITALAARAPGEAVPPPWWPAGLLVNLAVLAPALLACFAALWFAGYGRPYWMRRACEGPG